MGPRLAASTPLAFEICTRLLAEFGAEVIEIGTDGHPTTGHADVLERAQTTYGVQ